MAEYFEYIIKPLDKNKNLVKMLEERNLINIFSQEQISIRIENNGISNRSRWEPDYRLRNAISTYFPDEIFIISQDWSEKYGSSSFFYYKNNQQVSKDGKPVITSIYQINFKLLKEKNGNFQICLPIGEEPNKWGKIDIPKENIFYNIDSVTGIKNDICVFFTEEMIDVTFPSGTIKMSSKEIKEKYYQKVDDYITDMNSIIEIENFPEDNLKKMTGMNTYYIVNIPCSKTISENGFISTTISNSKLNEDTIYLGRKGSYKKIIIEKNGKKEHNWMTNYDIKKHYEDVTYNRITNNNDIQQDDIELE